MYTEDNDDHDKLIKREGRGETKDNCLGNLVTRIEFPFAGRKLDDKDIELY